MTKFASEFELPDDVVQEESTKKYAPANMEVHRLVLEVSFLWKRRGHVCWWELRYIFLAAGREYC